MASVAAFEEQSSLLEEAFGFAAEQRFYLRKAIQQNDVEMAMRYSICMANELRSSTLLPENYYKLYTIVLWELQHLAAFVQDTDRHGYELSEVYEMAQYEGNVLPRMYLLVTVGTVYLQDKDAPVQEILEDLSSMLSGVQHPMRGLFLRYYLLQSVKDKLLQLGGLRASLQYLLSNLREATSLWARLRLMDKMEMSVMEGVWRLDRNRHTLRLLIAAHLMHMARLPKLSVELYSEVLLPEVLRQCVGCEDAAGQAYLLQCFVEVFPDHFHLLSLERVLAACAQVHWVVDLRPLLQQLMQRLTTRLRSGLEGVDASKLPETYSLFHAHLKQLHERPRSPATPLSSLLALQLELCMSSLALHPGNSERVELLLGDTVELLRKGSEESLDSSSQATLVDILAAPLTQESLVSAVLAMPHPAALMAYLGRAAQKEGALAMVTAILAGDVAISDCDTLHCLLSLADRLIRDEGPLDTDGFESVAATTRHLEHDPEAFAKEQECVAKLVHQVRNPDYDTTYQMLRVLRDYFDEGGPYRIVFTLPPLVVATVRLVSLSRMEWQAQGAARKLKMTKPEELFQFAHETCGRLGTLRPEESLRLWLLCAAAVEHADWGTEFDSMGTTCSMFMDSALEYIEQHIGEPQAQFRGLQLLVGTLRQATCLQASKYKEAASRVMSVGANLPAKHLQSKAMCVCASLFWGPAHRDSGRALHCLRRTLQLADNAIHIDPTAVGLFVEALDQAAYLFSNDNPDISAPHLSWLLLLCVEHVRYVESRVPTESLRSLHTSLQDLQAKHAEALERSQGQEEIRPSDKRYAQLQLEQALTTRIPLPPELEAQGDLQG